MLSCSPPLGKSKGATWFDDNGQGNSVPSTPATGTSSLGPDRAASRGESSGWGVPTGVIDVVSQVS